MISLGHFHRTAVPTGFGSDRDAVRMGSQWRRIAVSAFTLLTIASVAPAYAEPDSVDPSANYSVFLQAIAGDGIVVDSRQAILEGQAVCNLMRPPNDASLWDAGRHVASMHSDWGMGLALHFADRSVQHLCPHRGSF
ncbi:DUF732 domain-containing protein [Mycolicibacterium aichiense]|uniref:DUF732 domain-containing protein n=1 Tax=Mycolicibacterium aichiense TaxID=1799 RepID=A0AAD1HQW6_9MYCO|nr:DUF732 domain-containing protein [Mycolicibacterium aichiense]MCV7017596.1 DUF732 domain-containing protein [Mycolicibacterium aichiense]BBX09305.1 hypothetical protein MAIC_41080 [Mycolicibacterium aichiense]SUA13871.1 Protein of uncharacterised function (DUF732) [Mycolicibacterium aichiense]